MKSQNRPRKNYGMKLAPLGQRDINRAPRSRHARKKNGDCRKDCRVCEKEKNELDALNNPEHVDHLLYVCRAKGRYGSPTVDEAGYELDYEKVMELFKPCKSLSILAVKQRIRSGKIEESFEREDRKTQQMADIFFEEAAAPDVKSHDSTIDAIKEKVEKDIGVPWHKVGLDSLKEWEAKGFQKAKKGEYVSFSREDLERFSKFSRGSDLRK